MTDIERVLCIAQSLDWVRENGVNKGDAIREMLRLTGLPEGHPWCAAFVAHCGHRGSADWPLPMTAGCAVLGSAAEKQKLLKTEPAVGAVFLLYYPSMKRFAHTGFCVAKNADGSWTTIEGNTNPGGGRDGYGVFARTRSWSDKDRFIWWWPSSPSSAGGAPAPA